MRSSLFQVASSLVLFLSFASFSACKDQAQQKECAKFRSTMIESAERAAAAVPSEVRQRETAPPQRAAWHRKLADAFEQESSKPAQFTDPRLQGFESQIKKSYAQTAAALRKTADGFDKGDKTLTEQGQIEDAKANGERGQILVEADKSCAK